jgi:site-specific DNA-methyltransferase (adenine-specific)
VIELHNASCIDWLASYDGPLFDSCVTDPPYELGFMGKAWDSSGIAFSVDTWRAVYDRLKPGAHLVAFSGTRTYHRMACAIEDAGFEIRDQLAWTYGSGFPKSLDVSKAIDKAAGVWRGTNPDFRNGPNTNSQSKGGGKFNGYPNTGILELDSGPATPDARKWQGYGTAIKPAWEPICLARKPLSEKTVAANVLKWGTGALNVDGCRVEGADALEGRSRHGGGTLQGSSFQMPDSRSTMPAGRFPANIIHDGSDEVLAGFPETGAASGGTVTSKPGQVFGGGKGLPAHTTEAPSDNGGSAARFFYSAKAGPLDRIGSSHATVKPVDVMRWLARLVTPKGGRILEPFAGSGTTGIAAMAEGFDCTMIELLADHCTDIERKLAYLRGEGASRVVEHTRHKANRSEGDELPLFAA